MKKINYSVLFLTTFLISNILPCEQSTQDQCSPTEYIMQFLAKSGTYYHGSSDWVESLKKNKAAKTNYVATRGTRLIESSGIVVSAHTCFSVFSEVPVDTVKAYFELSLTDDDCVIIASRIEDIEVRKVLDADEIAKVKTASLPEEKLSDTCSECTSVIKVDWDKKTNTLRTKMKTRCESKIPLTLFLKELNKQRNKQGF